MIGFVVLHDNRENHQQPRRYYTDGKYRNNSVVKY